MLDSLSFASEEDFGFMSRKLALPDLGKNFAPPFRRDRGIALRRLADLDSIAVAKGDENVIQPAVYGWIAHAKLGTDVLHASPGQDQRFDEANLFPAEPLQRPEMEISFDAGTAAAAVQAGYGELVLADGAAPDHWMHGGPSKVLFNNHKMELNKMQEFFLMYPWYWFVRSCFDDRVTHPG
jgi:hypothetical protein